jgi:hypothetical protein
VLPLNSQQVFQYKLLRFFYLAITTACISVGLYFFKSNAIEYKIFGLVGTISCLLFLFVFRSLLFPPDFKSALTTTLGLIVNYFIVVYLVPDGWLFACFYIFYSTICFQGLILIVYVCLIFLRKNHNLPDFIIQRSWKNNKSILFSLIILFASSVFLVLYQFSQLFMSGIRTAPADQQFWIWLSFFLDLAQQGFIVTRIIMATGYSREINNQQYKLMHNWDWAMKIIFIVALAGIVFRMLYFY